MTTYEEERAMDQAFEAHQDRLATEQDEREEMAGEVVRYILITVTLPDGSYGTPDPEAAVEKFIEEVGDCCGEIISAVDSLAKADFDVIQAYPDDRVGGGD